MPTSAASERRTDPGAPPLRTVRLVLAREEAERTASVLRAVSDPTRLQLLSVVHHSPDGRVRVKDLATALELRSPTISHHVSMLVDAGVLVREPVGREAWFSIVPDRLAAIADLLR